MSSPTNTTNKATSSPTGIGNGTSNGSGNGNGNGTGSSSAAVAVAASVAVARPAAVQKMDRSFSDQSQFTIKNDADFLSHIDWTVMDAASEEAASLALLNVVELDGDELDLGYLVEGGRGAPPEAAAIKTGCNGRSKRSLASTTSNTYNSELVPIEQSPRVSRRKRLKQTANSNSPTINASTTNTSTSLLLILLRLGLVLSL